MLFTYPIIVLFHLLKVCELRFSPPKENPLPKDGGFFLIYIISFSVSCVFTINFSAANITLWKSFVPRG